MNGVGELSAHSRPCSSFKGFFFQWKLLSKLLSKNCYFNSHACMCNPEATVIKILYTSGGVTTLVDGSM